MEQQADSAFTRCRILCSGKRQCCLNSKHHHSLCICDDPACRCHSAKRYMPRVFRDPMAGIQTYRLRLGKP